MATRLKSRRSALRTGFLWAAFGACSVAGAAEVLPPLTDAGHIGGGWSVATLPQQSKPVTRFSAVQVDGRAAVRLQADASYGNLVRVLPDVAAPARLRWSWRLQRANPAVDLRRKAGDDVPAKVCLSFDLPLEQLSFMERQKMRLARDFSGQALPAATLCWVWGEHEAVGALIDNAYSRRLRYLVLRNAGDPLSSWLEEDRDVAADFLRAFGDESTVVPPLVLVGIGADADNTGGKSVAQVADLRFAD